MGGWAAIQTVKVLGGGVAAVLVTFGTQVWAQMDGLGSITEWVAGGTLFISAGLIVRWVLATSKTVEEKWIGEISRLEKKVERLEEQKAAVTVSRDEWQSKYWQLWAERHGESRP